MDLLDHLCLERSALKMVCDVCGDLSIKAASSIDAKDDERLYCRRCNAVRGTMAGLRDLARRATGEFEF
jgi:hypothetical protein